ncbi:hypothetical protein [Falsiroseomonas sp.]|uniref:hypothetical protein n=1 Tax=Falsiroseomonas sp. TaxID=2870721 RepID=UPI002716EDBD|nr:hypothetical protein [Falsiroseomonas sp.]MDO9499953.1 hypothetical protein [Falsiroseomonas sp.]
MRALFAFLLFATPALAQPEPPACLFPRRDVALDAPCLALLAQIARDSTGDLIIRGFAQEQQGPRVDGLISRRRAEAVAAELRRLGVAPERLRVTTQPTEQRDLYSRVSSHDRRVEILAD